MSEVVNRFHEHADGSFTIQTLQDVEPYLERNKREALSAAKHGDGIGRKVASIPLAVAEKWRVELGFDILKDRDPAKLRALLNDPDNLFLRTSPGKL